MDYVRSCVSVDMRVNPNDPNETEKVHWYFVDHDSDVIEHPTPFGSRQWEFGDDDNNLGEVTSTRVWRDGSPLGTMESLPSIGSAELWSNGFDPTTEIDTPVSLIATWTGVTNLACSACSFFNSPVELEYIGNCLWRYEFSATFQGAPCYLKQITAGPLPGGPFRLFIIRNQLPTIEVRYNGPTISGMLTEEITLLKIVGGAACNWPLTMTVKPKPD